MTSTLCESTPDGVFEHDPERESADEHRVFMTVSELASVVRSIVREELDHVKEDIKEIRAELVEVKSTLKQHGYMLRMHADMLKKHGDMLKQHDKQLGELYVPGLMHYTVRTMPNRNRCLRTWCPPSCTFLDARPLLRCRRIVSANHEFQARKGQYDYPGAYLDATRDLLTWLRLCDGFVPADMFVIAWFEPTQQPASGPIVYKHPLQGTPQPALVEICIGSMYRRRGNSCEWGHCDTTFEGVAIVAYKHTVVRVVGAHDAEGVFVDWSIEQVYVAAEGMSVRLCSSIGGGKPLPAGPIACSAAHVFAGAEV